MGDGYGRRWVDHRHQRLRPAGCGSEQDRNACNSTTEYEQKACALPAEIPLLQEGGLKALYRPGQNAAALKHLAGGNPTIVGYLRSHLNRLLRRATGCALGDSFEMDDENAAASWKSDSPYEVRGRLARGLYPPGLSIRVFLHSTGQAYKLGGPTWSSIPGWVTCDDRLGCVWCRGQESRLAAVRRRRRRARRFPGARRAQAPRFAGASRRGRASGPNEAPPKRFWRAVPDGNPSSCFASRVCVGCVLGCRKDFVQPPLRRAPSLWFSCLTSRPLSVAFVAPRSLASAALCLGLAPWDGCPHQGLALWFGFAVGFAAAAFCFVLGFVLRFHSGA